MAMMTAQTRQPQMGLTFEDVWAAMMETREQMKETDKKFQETDKKFQETDKKFQETERLMKESKAEHDRMIAEIKESAKELNRQMGGLHHSFGDLAANLVAPNLPAKFRELGYTFTKCSCEMKFTDSAGITLAEVDAWLENGDAVLAAEIKGKLLKGDVDDHLARMKVLQGYAKEHGDKRKLLGAVAGGIMRKDARDYAVKSGFYVIEQSGDTLKIDMPKGFKPKAW